MRFIKAITLLLFFIPFWAAAAPLNNPQDVVYNHLYYLQSDHYDPTQSSKSFLPNAKLTPRTAIKLKQILDGRGIYIDLDAIPSDPNFMDSTSQIHQYVLSAELPEITIAKIANEWGYSPQSVEAIPELFDKTFPFGTQFHTYFHAPFWQIKTFGVALYKWLMLLILALGAYLAFHLIYRILQPIIGFIGRLNLHLGKEIEKPVAQLARLAGLYITIIIVQWIVPVVMLPVKYNAWLIKGLDILSAFLIILGLIQIVHILFAYFLKMAEKTENTMDDQLMPVLKKISQIIIWIIGLVFILRILNVNVTALLAGVSIGGLALALAAQDTVKNFFGSLVIFLDRPFQIGDWIHTDKVDGIVEEVGVRSTRIRTFANSITYVPNALLANEVVDNLGMRRYRRYKTEIGITYDTPPEIIDIFIDGIRELILAHPTTRKDYFEVHLNEFSTSSLNIMLYMFFEAPSWTDELKGRHHIMQGIIKLAHSMGVRFAFPTQTLHIEEFPGNMTSTPTPLKTAEARIMKDKTIEEMSQQFDRADRPGKIKPIGGE
jgi:MscS family membrane protein